MQVKAILLGEAPGPGGGTWDPLGQKTAKQLCEFAGWGPESGPDPYRSALVQRFELRNLLDFSPGRVGKGSLFPMGAAREAAEKMSLEGRDVVCLGKRVAKAIGAPDGLFVIEERNDGSRVGVISHPSGINLVYNDSKAREAAGKILREFAS